MISVRKTPDTYTFREQTIDDAKCKRKRELFSVWIITANYLLIHTHTATQFYFGSKEQTFSGKIHESEQNYL